MAFHCDDLGFWLCLLRFVGFLAGAGVSINMPMLLSVSERIGGCPVSAGRVGMVLVGSR